MKGSVLKLIIICTIALAGCNSSNDDSSDVACTEEYVPAITIEVKDKDTGDFIGCGATVIIEDTGFSEEIVSEMSGSCDNSSLFQGAYERDGIYDVHISKEGYLDWSKYSISVTSNVCHVNTVHIVAELEK
ncbi:MAG: hypothetical protein OCD00_05760 [Colwellia sp.]